DLTYSFRCVRRSGGELPQVSPFHRDDPHPPRSPTSTRPQDARQEHFEARLAPPPLRPITTHPFRRSPERIAWDSLRDGGRPHAPSPAPDLGQRGSPPELPRAPRRGCAGGVQQPPPPARPGRRGVRPRRRPGRTRRPAQPPAELRRPPGTRQ